MSNPLSVASGKVSLFAKWFAGIGLLIMTAIIAMQVFARYVLNDSPAWAEQAALLLMIWCAVSAPPQGAAQTSPARMGVSVSP